MKKTIITFLFFTLFTSSWVTANESVFNRGIVYYLISEYSQAKANWDQYFSNSSLATVKNGFNLLLQKKNWEAAKEFKKYLDVNYRSGIALVGISLATSDLRDYNSLDNLQRALRMDPQYSPAHLCLGFEYMKQNNFPAAERHMNRALRFGGVPEYKIILSQLYLKFNEPKIVADMLRREADSSPDNFYYNFFTGKALFLLGRFEESRKYVQSAMDVNPADNNVKLLLAKYYLATQKPREAKDLLQDIQFKEYNLDYVKTLAEVQFVLQDRKARDRLYEVFSQEKWDAKINLLLARIASENPAKENVQNWILRVLLSGNNPDSIKTLFPSNYEFPGLKTQAFFNVKSILWLSDSTLLAAAEKESGQAEKIYIIDSEANRVIQTIAYTGTLDKIAVSGNREHVVFSSRVETDDKTYVYVLKKQRNNYLLRPVTRGTLRLRTPLIEFNGAGTLAYITDAAIESLAFESPFAIVSESDRKRSVFPDYPFPIYRFNFNTMSLTSVTDDMQKRQVPVHAVKKYYFLLDAMGVNSQVKGLVQKGQSLDLTSSEIVRVYFSPDLSAFCIYLADLKNPFQGLIYETKTNRAVAVDETMFLGKGRYAEIRLLGLSADKKELIILTRDKDKALIKYDYTSRLYTKLDKDVLDFYYDRELDTIYALTERSNKVYYSDTNLMSFTLNPFSKNRNASRRDINNIIGRPGNSAHVCFSSYNGELLLLDDDDNLQYLGPCFEGSVHAISDDWSKTAAFINSRLVIFQKQ